MGGRDERRTRRELATVGAMIAIHCRGHHGRRRGLCDDCRELLDYARRRVERCPLLDDKPTCVHCPVHCYSPAMRDRIRAVMRYAGPRMPWRHPVLAILHALDGRRDRSRPSVVGRTGTRRAGREP
jgi:hypothetical protein